LSVPILWWIWWGLSLLISILIAYSVGYWLGKTAPERILRKAGLELDKLYRLTIESIELTQKSCAALVALPKMDINKQQLKLIDNKRMQLWDVIGKISDRVTATQSAYEAPMQVVAEQKKKSKQPTKIEMDWIRTAEDERSQLPDDDCVRENLKNLITRIKDKNARGSLMLVKVDKWSQFPARYGREIAWKILKKMGRVLIRASRDEDFIGHLSNDTFAILLPNITFGNGGEISEAIRSTVRNHHFRLEEFDREVFVTASFGFTECQPDDLMEDVLNRAALAVSQAERRGRNQLYLHNGLQLQHARSNRLVTL